MKLIITVLAAFAAICEMPVLAGEPVPVYANNSKTSPKTGDVRDDLFIKARGSELYMGNKKYREIGVNVYQLLAWYIDRGWECPKGQGVAKGERALRDLSQHGMGTIRVMASPFEAEGFYEVFFDKDLAIQEDKRKEFFVAFDRMLRDCRRFGIRIVPSLVWNMSTWADLGGNSLHEAVTDQNSRGYKRTAEYIVAVVSRYKNEKAIAFWEIGNEYALFADLQKPEGVLHVSNTDATRIFGYKLVRTGQNNFTSRELARFYGVVAALIKKADSNHLVTTGDSIPRLSAMHLLRAAEAGVNIDWNLDDTGEHEACLKMVNGAADIISIHFYESHLMSLEWYAEAARRIGKPIFVGEVGPEFKVTANGPIADYVSSRSLEDLSMKLFSLGRARIPISLFWNYGSDDPPFQLLYGKSGKALKMIERANRKAKKVK